jgi:hypothetical protein
MVQSHKPFTLYKSKTYGKKWDVYIPKGNRIKKVSYGAAGMSDYTKHKDKERREKYRSRHKNDHIDDPYKAGFWSWWHLWGRTSDSKKAFEQAVRKAKNILRYV